MLGKFCVLNANACGARWMYSGQDEVRAALAALYPAVYSNPTALHNQWSLPGFMTELK